MGQGSSVWNVCGELEFKQEEKFKDKLEAQLIQAAEKGDHEVIWNILSDAVEAGVEFHSTTAMSSPIHSPSHIAALRGNARALHALWYGKFPVDTPLHDGRTPLFFAVLSPRDRAVSVLKVLIDNAHVDVNRTAQHGDSALFNATLIGRVELINQLAAAGASVDCATHHGTTPLMVASERGDIASVKALLALKADVTRTSTSGSTALLAAAELGHGNTSKLLIEAGAEVNARRRGGGTPVHAACAHGWAHVVELLCHAGADVNLALVDGQTPLHSVLEWAAHGRDAMVAAFGDTSHISNHSTNIDADIPLPINSLSVVTSTSVCPNPPPSTSSFQSPFPTSSLSSSSSSSSYSSPSASKYKTNPELKSRDRESPRVVRRPRSYSLPVVHEDAEEDDEDDEFGSLLASTLDNKANTSSADDVGSRTSLFDIPSSYSGSSNSTIRVPSLALRIIEILLDHGANTSACLIGGNGESPLHLACRHGLVGCARLLAPHSNVRLPAGDEATTPLHLAAKFGHTEIIDILLKADEMGPCLKGNRPYVDTRDAGGEAPLHLAARYGEIGAIRRLVKAGAEVDARRLFDQATPLTIAALFNRISAAKLLVRFGASLRPMKLDDLGTIDTSLSLQPSDMHIGDGSKSTTDGHEEVSGQVAVWTSPVDQAMEWGHQELADHLHAVEKAGYIAWLAAPRMQLVHLRILAAAGRASFIGHTPGSVPMNHPDSPSSSEPSSSFQGSSLASFECRTDSHSSTVVNDRHQLRRSSKRDWTDGEVEKALRFILGVGLSPMDPHAPDNVFAMIASYWWP